MEETSIILEIMSTASRRRMPRRSCRYRSSHDMEGQVNGEVLSSSGVVRSTAAFFAALMRKRSNFSDPIVLEVPSMLSGALRSLAAAITSETAE
jgi:hypothetical protein